MGLQNSKKVRSEMKWIFLTLPGRRECLLIHHSGCESWWSFHSWRRMDEALEGSLPQADIGTNSERPGISVAQVPPFWYIFLQISYSEALLVIQHYPQRHSRLPPGILSVVILSDSVIPGMGFPNILMELSSVFTSQMNHIVKLSPITGWMVVPPK